MKDQCCAKAQADRAAVVSSRVKAGLAKEDREKGSPMDKYPSMPKVPKKEK